jgi:hypothetical protein
VGFLQLYSDSLLARFTQGETSIEKGYCARKTNDMEMVDNSINDGVRELVLAFCKFPGHRGHNGDESFTEGSPMCSLALE